MHTDVRDEIVGDGFVGEGLVGRRCFVTGATGFLGYAIARALVEAGADVVALARGPLPGDLGARGVRTVHGDLLDANALDRGLEGASIAFHVAADVRMSRRFWAEAHRTNVEGTRLLLDRARRAGVARFVFTSSGSTLGKPLDAVRGPIRTIDESSPYDFGGLGWVYPHTKWLAEELVLAADAGEFETVVTHPTAIVGPWDWKRNLLPLFRAPHQLLGLVTTGGARTVCDVRDVADGHLRAALRGRRGGRYALAGEAMTILTLQTLIAETTGGRAPRVVLPPATVRALGRALDAVATLRGTTALLSEEMAIQSTLRVVVSSAKAERELGYRSRPAIESMRDAAGWYREQGWL